jgi:glycosyltransferase involved in cell wall biosynthesis
MSKTPPAVSVIIPVYNTEAYLEECLDSVCRQSFDNMEILMVNDGSTDGSLRIILTYMERDPRIVLLDKNNEGVGAARNAALRMAQGEYILFLDSDDAFAPDALRTIYQAIRQARCDILIFNGRAFEDDGKEKKWHENLYFDLDEKDENHVETGLYWIERTGGQIQQAGMKIYRRTFLIDHQLLFAHSRVGEDYYFFYASMIQAQRVAYLHCAGYMRRYRAGSLMTDHSSFGTRERIHSFRQIAATLDWIPDRKHRRVVAVQHAYYACALWVRSMIRKNPSEREALLQDYQSGGLCRFVRENRVGWRLHAFYALIWLPDVLRMFQIMIAKMIRWAYQSRTRLL